MGQKETAMNGKNRIMIYGPKADGTYLVEFRTAAGYGIYYVKQVIYQNGREIGKKRSQPAPASRLPYWTWGNSA
jgi:hypothetical protein